MYARVRRLAGNELVVAQQIDQRASVELRTHWQPGILVTDRLVGGGAASGSVYQIVAADNIENKNRELRLTCVEVVA